MSKIQPLAILAMSSSVKRGYYREREAICVAGADEIPGEPYAASQISFEICL